MPTVPAQTFDNKAIKSFKYFENLTTISSKSPYRPYPEYLKYVDEFTGETIPVSGAWFLRNSASVPWSCLIASDTSGSVRAYNSSGERVATYSKQSFTYNQKTVYYYVEGITNLSDHPPYVNQFELVTTGGADIEPVREMAWLMVYGGYIDGYTIVYDLQNCTGDSGNPSIIEPNATVTNFDFTADTDASFTSGSVWIDGSGFPSGTPVVFSWSSETGHLRIGPVTTNITIHVHAYKDPYNNLPTGGDDPIPGAGAVPEPGLPGLSASSTGIMGLFCPTVAQMQQLSDFMWTDFGGQGTTVIEVLEEIVEAIKRAISNPLDYIFGLNIIPSQGLSIGNSKVVKFGFVNSGVSMPVLTDHYFIVDCGSVSFDVLCGDSFLDYAPYSKFSIYLPYIGFKDIDPNDCVGHTISVKYHGDAITGGLTAYVFKDGNVMYQYSGGCALNVPLSADNWGATIASAASIATGVISAAATGGAAGVGLAAAKGAASVAANPSLLSPQVMHSGAVSGAPGFMGVQYPFIIREAVNFHSTVGFNKESGYPAYYYKSLSEVAGFTTVLDPHINNIPQATQSEMAEIISLLESGVIL